MITLHPPTNPPQGEMLLPGSKSFTNRALIAAALSPGESTLLYASQSNDTELLLNALRKIGITIDARGDELSVHGCNGELQPFSGEIYIGPAGTTSRFLLSVLAQIPVGEILLTGTERMHERPIAILVEALRSLGADIQYMGRDGCLPLKISGVGGLQGGDIEIDPTMSSQYLTSLLLLAPVLPNGLRLHWRGDLISRSYIMMTLETLASFGVDVLAGDQFLKVSSSQTYTSARYVVEGDASGGSYFWGLAAVTAGEIFVKNICPNSEQGDVHFPAILEKMGCEVVVHDYGVSVRGKTSLVGTVADMEHMPDTAQTLAVISAFAKGTTSITGLSTLKHKETDRLVAVQRELAKSGIESEITNENITVIGGAPKAATIDTYHDHRMAMSFALLGARVPGVKINDPQVVEKSFPNFWDMLASFGVDVT